MEIRAIRLVVVSWPAPCRGENATAPVGSKTANGAARARWSRYGTKELSMTKTLNLIHEAVRNTKHPFRQADNRPAKAQKNRYERRKIREFLRLGNWMGEQLEAKQNHKTPSRLRTP